MQYSLLTDTFTTDVTQWQGMIDTPIDGNGNTISSDGVAKTLLPLWTIIEKLDALKSVSQTEIISNKFISSNGSLDDSNRFSAIVYELSDISPVVKIHANTRYNNPYFAFYSTNSFDSEHCVGISEIHSGNEYSSKDFVVALLKNAAYLVIQAYNYPAASPNLYSYDIDSIAPFLKLITQTLTNAQKKQVLANIGISENDFIILSYWGQSASSIQALSPGQYFFNTYTDLVNKKTGAVGTTTIEVVPKKQCQLFFSVTNAHFYAYIDEVTLTDISSLEINSFIVNALGNSTTKVMSQKAVTDNLNSLEKKVESTIIGKDNALPIPYESYQTDKYIISSGDVAEISSSYKFNYYVYDISNIRGRFLNITASQRYTNPFYAFYSSREISHSTLIEMSEMHSGSTASYETFENVLVPNNATILVVNYVRGNNFPLGVENVVKFILNNPYSSLYNKKWACVGDSLTEINDATTKHYYDYVAEETGIIPMVYGVGGSGYARKREDNLAFYQRIANIDINVDVVTIFGSFNDLGAITDDFPLGTVDDSGIISVAGCINATIDALYTVKPIVRLGIIAPTPWARSQPGSNIPARNYVNLLSEISQRRSIPFLDLWRHSNLRPWDSSFAQLVFSEDPVQSATHPNAIGHSIIAPMFREFVKSLL